MYKDHIDTQRHTDLLGSYDTAPIYKMYKQTTSKKYPLNYFVSTFNDRALSKAYAKPFKQISQSHIMSQSHVVIYIM